jgi:hypothetical protein
MKLLQQLLVMHNTEEPESQMNGKWDSSIDKFIKAHND